MISEGWTKSVPKVAWAKKKKKKRLLARSSGSRRRERDRGGGGDGRPSAVCTEHIVRLDCLGPQSTAHTTDNLQKQGLENFNKKSQAFRNNSSNKRNMSPSKSPSC